MKIIFSTAPTYGIIVRTVPDVQADTKFVTHIANSMLDKLPKDTSQETQRKFVFNVQEIINNITNKCTVFSNIADHYGRDIRRFLVDDKDNHFNYIVDCYSVLDIRRKLNWWQRLIYRLKRKNPSDDSIEVFYTYCIKIWNTPVTYYIIEVAECTSRIKYSEGIESARNGVGLPYIYNPFEKDIYDRTDIYTRRALFREIYDVIAERVIREGENSSIRDNLLRQ